MSCDGSSKMSTGNLWGRRVSDRGRHRTENQAEHLQPEWSNQTAPTRLPSSRAEHLQPDCSNLTAFEPGRTSPAKLLQPDCLRAGPKISSQTASTRLPSSRAEHLRARPTLLQPDCLRAKPYPVIPGFIPTVSYPCFRPLSYGEDGGRNAPARLPFIRWPGASMPTKFRTCDVVRVMACASWERSVASCSEVPQVLRFLWR